jgi:hypothetical protein
MGMPIRLRIENEDGKYIFGKANKPATAPPELNPFIMLIIVYRPYASKSN